MKLKDFLKNHRMTIYTTLGILGVFLVWYLISLILNTTLFPSPIVVIPEFARLFILIDTYAQIGGTLLRLVISLAISLLVGTAFGVLGGVFERFRAFFKPFVTVFKTIPTAAVVFILIVLIKPLFTPVVVTFLITFPIIYESVVTGFTSVDENVVDAMKVDGANKFKSIFRVYLPLSKNYILLALIQIIGLGMKVSIMAEILAGSDSVSGLGREIYYGSLTGDVKMILAYSLIAILIIGLSDVGLYFAKKKLKVSK